MKNDAAVPSGTPHGHDSGPDPVRIGILGHVGNENLGDESIIAAVIQNIRRRWPNAEISGFTLVPEDTEKRHGIASFPIRRRIRNDHSERPAEEGSTDTEGPADTSALHRIKELIKRVPILSTVARGTLRVIETVPAIGLEVSFLFECRRRAKGLDLLIFAGSHQLNDFVDGPWAYPYTVLKWTLLARGAGAKVVFLSLGAGPIDTKLGRRFIRSALQLASYRSYRDVTSKQAVDSIQVFATDQIVPDLAFSLAPPLETKKGSGGRGPIVGINPLPLYADYWYLTDENRYETYVGKLARFADWLVDRGCEVHFIPTQLKVDPAVIGDVRTRMISNSRPEFAPYIVEPTIHSLTDLLSALGELDFMVATRYHGILLSLALHKPVLAIAYHAKSRDLMGWLGQGDYVIGGDTFSVAELTERFPLLEKESGSIASALRLQTPGFRAAVEAQYDTVFGLVERA